MNVKNLRDRSLWASGWLQKVELQGMDTQGPECKECAGEGTVPCPLCATGGRIVEL